MKPTTFLIALAGLAAAPVMAAAAGGGQDHRDRVAFEVLDTDGNGELSQAELAAHGAQRFARTDTDKDGLLSAEEIVAQMKTANERRATRMIAFLDQNDDGKLSPDELQRRGDPGKMFDRLDADNSGGVSEEEFAEARDQRRHRRGFGHGHGIEQGGD